jgi:hypothetical protein
MYSWASGSTATRLEIRALRSRKRPWTYDRQRPVLPILSDNPRRSEHVPGVQCRLALTNLLSMLTPYAEAGFDFLGGSLAIYHRYLCH